MWAQIPWDRGGNWMQISYILYKNSKHGLVGNLSYSAYVPEGADVGTRF